MIKDILILGGTGVMGTYLVDLLDRDNYSLFITTRKSLSDKNNIHYIQGNAHDLKFVKPLVESKKWHAIIDFMNYSTAEFENKHEIFLNNTDQYIFLSSARVYSGCSNPITEESSRLIDSTTDVEYLKTDDYSLAKAREENILFSFKEKNWTIIRPYMSYYKYKLDLGYFAKELWLYRILHNRKIWFPKDVASKYTTLTSGYDVAKGIISIIGKDEAKGEVFHITENNSYKWQDIINIYKKVLGSKGYEFNVIYLDKPSIQSEYIYKYDRVYNRIFNNQKINNFINNNDFTSATIGIRNAIEEFLINPLFNKIDWKRHAYWDKITNEHTPLNEIPNLKNKIKYIIFRYIISFELAFKLKKMLST